MSFQLLQENGEARAGILHTPHGPIKTPHLSAVVTAGALKGVTPEELKGLGVQSLLANSYHLYLRPGHEVVEQLGGLHRFVAWDGPIVSDSGGFQAFSLGFSPDAAGIGMDASPARPEEMTNRNRGQDARLVKATDDGVTFTSHIDGSQHRLTPEVSIRIQEALGADIAMSLDEPTVDAGRAKQAMTRTHAWARRALDVKTRDDQALFGVVQGGASLELRAESARYIGSLPFSGAAIGGSLGASVTEMQATLGAAIPLLPEEWPRHVSAAGEPEELLAGVERGVDHFDAVTPTRLARQGVLYTAQGKVDLSSRWHEESIEPIEPGCLCYTCQDGFSRGYLHHLLATDELLAYTLGSFHNLYFVNTLMRRIREAILADSFTDLRDEFLSEYLVGSPV